MVAGVSEVGVGPSGDGVAGVPGVGVGPMWCDRVAGTGKLLHKSVDSPSISWLWVSEGFAAMLWWMVGGCSDVLVKSLVKQTRVVFVSYSCQD